MKIIAVEPTPSPNTMKFTLSEELPQGTANNYNRDKLEEAPEFVKEIFKIEGVKGLYHVADFIAVDRHPKAEWQNILPAVKRVFGEEAEDEESSQIDEHFGEIQVQVQMFKDIPMQVKVTDGDTEHREALSAKFVDAVAAAAKPDDNVVMQRKWVEQRPRYGDLEEAAKEVAEEIEATYSKDRLDQLAASALLPEEEKKPARKWLKVTEEMLDVDDWKKRFALLEQMDPQLEDLSVLQKALNDEKPSIRRLAVVYLGMLESDEAVPYLEEAMKDKSVTVRRTAGDAFSDLGSKAGMDAMISALEDKSKLVRWRAAMFLYELGDERALPALKKAEEDAEFEVSLQAKLASARIESGDEAKGSVWKQMSEAFDKNE